MTIQSLKPQRYRLPAIAIALLSFVVQPNVQAAEKTAAPKPVAKKVAKTDAKEVAKAKAKPDAKKAGDKEGITPTPAIDKWTPLFNGKDLTGWTPKIRGFKVGDNYKNTFRVEEGLLKVSYDGYKDFGDKGVEKFGHLFYNQSFSHYKLRLVYRFVGDQCAKGPGWAFRNSGAMLHGQDPATMTIDQDFPVSIEAQLLGGKGQGKRTTMNLCTPGTNVVMKGKLFKPHCINSSSKTYHGDQWVTVVLEVRGSETIRHLIDGKVVLEYDKPQLDERDGNAQKIIAKQKGEKLLSQGTISLQSESHPVHYKTVEIMLLKP